MQRFARFTEEAKRSLTLAQAEAETAHLSYISTEHLLLGLIANPDAVAHRVLGGLGVETETVRKEIERQAAGEERASTRLTVPTSRVKKVIEIAFDDSMRGGDQQVDTGHLLLGLLIEGEGLSAHVLEELGVTVPRVRSELARVRGLEPGELPAPPHVSFHHPSLGVTAGADLPSLGPDAAELLHCASAMAAADGVPAVGLEHLVRAFEDEAVRSLLGLSARIRQEVAAREEAIAMADPRAAEEHREEERRLRREHDQSEAEWRRRLRETRGPGPS